MNQTTKLGVALSIYNKRRELEINLKIIRERWSSHNDCYVSVCCNDPETFKALEGNTHIDNLIFGDDIQITNKAHKRMRIVDCIEKSVSNCAAEYVIHYHADAYALKSEPILQIIEEMEKNGYLVAFRGRGLDFRNNKCIHGDVDDHFVIFNRRALDERKLFDVSTKNLPASKEQYLSVGNGETFLSFLIQASFSRDEIFWYDDMRNNIVDETREDHYYPDGIMHRSMIPYNIDENRKFIHVNDFSDVTRILSKYDVGDVDLLVKHD